MKRRVEGLAPCRPLPGVVDVRVRGGVVGFEALDSARLCRAVAEQGVWIRPMGKRAYAPPSTGKPRP